MRRSKKITVAGEELDVREISWHAMLDLLRKLTEYGGKLYKDGKLALNLEQIGEAIASTDELTSILICESTGKDPAWLNDLQFGDALDVLDAAIEINLAGDIMDKAKKVGGRLKQMLGVKAAVTIAPTQSPPE